jgi:hypothetical protein
MLTSNVLKRMDNSGQSAGTRKGGRLGQAAHYADAAVWRKGDIK